MSIQPRQNLTPLSLLVPSITMVLLLIIAYGLFKVYIGNKFNHRLTDIDIAKYTSSLGKYNECYFDNLTIVRDQNGNVSKVIKIDINKNIFLYPVIDSTTKQIIGLKVNNLQIMYCNTGILNYKTSVITLDRVLSESSYSVQKINSRNFRRDLSNKYIDKIWIF